MNKFAMLMCALIAFLVPIGVVISMNADQLTGDSDAGPRKSNGKLVYYYSPS